METLLAASIEAARRGGVIQRASVQQVIVDTTVMPKAIAHPTDSRLLDKSRQHLVKVAEDNGLKLRQNYNRVAPRLYALHAPEVECISKGKARTPYEFGVKVSIATTLKEGLVVGMRSMPGNPYDGHTLAETLEQVGILTGTDRPPATAIVDKGYRGVEIEGVAPLMASGRALPSKSALCTSSAKCLPWRLSRKMRAASSSSPAAWVMALMARGQAAAACPPIVFQKP